MIEELKTTARTHVIPKMVNKFARTERMSDRYGSDPPTVHDIYLTLISEGLSILETGAKPVFREVKKPEGAKGAVLRIPKKSSENAPDELNEKLQKLDKRIQSGEYEFLKPTDSKGRITNSISLISIAVNLMELALTKGRFSEAYKALLERGN